MADKVLVEKLRKLVYEHRINILKLMNSKGKIHIGGDMSCAEMMVTLFQHAMRIDPQDPEWPDRDRFILSKGHGGGAMYLVMAQAGYFNINEVFDTYKGYETRFGIHPCKAACHELDASSGSLGHGLSISCGLALGARMDSKDYRVFCVLGDGELDEGSNWEAAMLAAQQKLGNLIAIVDRNGLCLDGSTEDILALEPLGDKWTAFGWNVIHVDGHDIEAVIDVLDNLPARDSDRPTVIIAHTVKGKGVSYMENNALYHNAAVSEEEFVRALEEIDEAYRKDGGNCQ